jgi:electron transport complex protein RnfC
MGCSRSQRGEVNARPPMPCIRCANCVGACPCGLLPLEMAAHTRVGDLEGAVRLGLLDCIGCSACAYVCPAHIPLVQCFNYAKGEMAARGRAKQKQTETKRLAEQRAARIEAQQRAKREAMARRKQEAAAQRKAETPAEAKVGIFGKITPLTARVSDGDRVEIYRPITAAPEAIERRDRD